MTVAPSPAFRALPWRERPRSNQGGDGSDPPRSSRAGGPVDLSPSRGLVVYLDSRRADHSGCVDLQESDSAAPFSTKYWDISSIVRPAGRQWVGIWLGVKTGNMARLRGGRAGDEMPLLGGRTRWNGVPVDIYRRHAQHLSLDRTRLGRWAAVLVGGAGNEGRASCIGTVSPFAWKS